MGWHQVLSKIEILIAIKKKLTICCKKLIGSFLGAKGEIKILKNNYVMPITYNSTNKWKQKEIKNFYDKNNVWFKQNNIEFEFQKIDIIELQSGTLEEIVKHKAKEAYRRIKRPVLVEHTCLKITALNDLPNHLTGEIWKTLGGYKICEIVKNSWSNHAEAVTMLGYCDGKKVRVFEGSCHGKIAPEPRGNSEFQWDTIFIPDGQDFKSQTFAEMTQVYRENINNSKECYSMRTKALDKFLDFLKNNNEDKSVVEQFINYQKEYEESINEIKEVRKEKKLILFIGAGISKNIDMLSWGELVSKIGKNLGYEEELFLEKGDLLELASFGENKDINQLIRGVFNLKNSNKEEDESKSIKKEIKEIIEAEYMKEFRKKLQTSSVYNLITRLDCNEIYTTNYDRCIEEAIIYAANKKDIKVCTCIHEKADDGKSEDKTEPKFKSENKTKIKEYGYVVYKLHGDLKYESEFVLDRKSYDERYMEISKIELDDDKNKAEDKSKTETETENLKFYEPKKSELKKSEKEFCMVGDLNLKLKEDLAQNCVLFLGYGFGDSDINRIIINNKKNNKADNKHYAFMISPNEVKEKWLKDNNITPIVPKTGKAKEELKNFLRQINDLH